MPVAKAEGIAARCQQIWSGMNNKAQAAIRPLDDRNWVLETAIEWDEFTVPRGFVTDLASIPRFFWRVIPPFGLHSTPSIIHDYLYRRQPDGVSRKEADEVFLDAMQAYGVPKLRRDVMYRTVRMFGGRPWRKNAKKA